MSVGKKQVAALDVLGGTSLIMAGMAGLLVRLGVLNFSHAPQWLAFEQWWPLLLIIVGLVAWLEEMSSAEVASASRSSVEIRYGK
ncbi:MAG TPA: hypothetical protein VMU28_13985 [Terriglobales bacterium]|nr:hypothetical protein [Terriglobales bacterium]